MLKQCNRQWKHVLHQLDSAHLFVQHFVVCRAASTASSSIPELLEMREYTLKPKGIRPFMKLTNDKAALRSSLLPFLGYAMLLRDVCIGGDPHPTPILAQDVCV